MSVITPLLLIGALFVLTAFWSLLWACLEAKNGFEDDTGFHASSADSSRAAIGDFDGHSLDSLDHPDIEMKST